MSNFRFFTDQEVEGSDLEFVAKVDNARYKSGIPWKATCWRRSVSQNNAQKDSVKDSAHLTGHAVDVECTDDNMMGLMIEGAHAAGLNRVGIYIRKGPDGKWHPTHLHFDDDKTKLAHDIWITEEK